MTRHIPRISAMERDITTKHWLPNDSEHSYTWHTLDVEVVAAHYHTTQKTVRETMKRIERKHPAPNPDKNAELAKKAPTGDTCKKCGAPIVWVAASAVCDPPRSYQRYCCRWQLIHRSPTSGREVQSTRRSAGTH